MNPQIKAQIAKVPIFEGVDHGELIAFLDDSHVKEFEIDEFIFHEGEYDENCCIILSGRVGIKLPQKGQKRTADSIILHEGEIFGEIAALSGNPRSADIYAVMPSTILYIPRRKLFKLIDKFRSIKEKLDGLYRERALSNHLLTIPIFSGISDEFLENLKKNVTLHSYNDGDVVFSQGDEADAFYLVRYGFVKVSHKEDYQRERILAYLKEGNYFGEMGLLEEGEKRMATVSAINRSELIRISKEDFNMLTETFPNVRHNLEKVVEKRKVRNIEISENVHLEHTLSTAIESGIIQSKSILVIDTSKCVQCDTCKKACETLHDGESRLIRKGRKFNNLLLIPTSCRHCVDPICMSRCPTGAITRGFSGEIYHQDFCGGCGNCASLCPYGNISIVNVSGSGNTKSVVSLFSRIFFKNKGRGAPAKDAPLSGTDAGKSATVKTRKKAVKCDMCREYDFLGCVYNCPTGAARRVDPTEFFADISAIG